MKISYNWLREYIDISESPEETGHILTSTGLEVEGIEPFETVKGGLHGLVIGEVLTCSKHPNADKLSITTVDVGTGTPLNIVCGAPNVAAGQKVVVAVPGTTLYPSQGEPFTIKATKIRGQQSEGMICAEDEMGLGEGHDGIVVLNTDTPNGTPAASFFNVQSDYILEIGLTPNRADAASHIGVARDIRAAKNREVAWPSVEDFKVANKNLTIPVEIGNPEACPRYSALTITGVTVKESPAWLQNRLRSIGLTPINNVVDVTNFVCHEIGQPLHAFDAGKIAGNKVVVKTLPAGSRFITLDGKERTLQSTDLMICNQPSGPGSEKGMCIAGVFGGAESGITEQTKNIFLESAFFSRDYIRRTSQHHQLKTDASFRFERGTDPNMTIYALKRAALLIQETAGGTISSEIIDVYPHKITDRHIVIKDKNVNRLIGKLIPREEVLEILKQLDITVIDKKDVEYTVAVPPYRTDVTQEADVVEEILRIYGFNNVELSDHASTGYLAEFPQKDPEKYKRAVSEMLVSNGFYEIWTNSLTNKEYYEKHSISLKGEPVEMLNKLSEEQGILRQSMLFTGLEVCAHNINRKQKDLRLFEFGNIYWKDRRPTGESAFQQEERLAMFMTGNLETENWQHKTQTVSYYDLAQQVQQVISKSGIKKISQNVIEDDVLEYGIALFDEKKNVIGKVGKVKSAILKYFGLRQELFYAELNSALLFKAANPKLGIREVSKFPEVRRDLSLVLDRQVSFDEIRYVALSTEKKLIKDIIVFDVYAGENIPENKKAYAMGFTLQDETKTLTDEEIDKTMNRLMNAFEEKLGAMIRK